MIKIVKHWRVSLFNAEETSSPKGSVMSAIQARPNVRPFFTGYSPCMLRVTGSSEFLELFTTETGGETRLIRMDQIASIECTPVYDTEEKMESFAAAAAPLARWLRENGTPHSTAMVTQVRADLMSDEICIPLAESIKQ